MASVYLLAVFATGGLVWQLLAEPYNRLMGVQPLAPGVQICQRCSVPRRTLAVTNGLDPETFIWVGAGVAGLVLIGSFALIRRWQQRGGRVRTLLRRQRGQLASV